MASANSLADSHSRANACSDCATCGTSKLKLMLRKAAWLGSSAMAARASNCNTNTGGNPAKEEATTMRPGITPGTKPSREACCCTYPGLHADLRACKVKLNWASWALANWSSSLACAKASCISGNSGVLENTSANAWAFTTNSENSISFKGPWRFATWIPA